MKQLFKNAQRLLTMLCMGMAIVLGTSSCGDDDYKFVDDGNQKVDTGGKKVVGYLCYDGFDLKSGEKLVRICKEFKAKGVSELILDLRYNGGGYVVTENALASMLAPLSAVNSRAVYETEVFNEKLSKKYNSVTRFQTAFNYNELGVNYSTEGANIGLDKIYVLVSENTASASESIVVGLSPYVDIEVIGNQSHGKFCSGIVMGINELYEEKNFTQNNWGMYVMLSTYADKNGENKARPNGLTPDLNVDDNPFDGYELGDARETMLYTALKRAGMKETATTKAVAGISPTDMKLRALHNSTFGLRVMQAKDYAPLPPSQNAAKTEIQYADMFAYDVLKEYYLWNKEIEPQLSLLNPNTCTDPIATVEQIRHADDRWTCMMEDVEAMNSSLSGELKSNGMALQAGTIDNGANGEYFLVVTHVYANSPAQTAGIKRGMVLTSYNGAPITEDNLEDAYYGDKTSTYSLAHIEQKGGNNVIVEDGADITLNPVSLYADPVIVYKTFEID